MTKDDKTTRPDPKDADKPMKPSGTARQPRHDDSPGSGAASDDPTA